ncbi:MAG: SDR family NAD(P)-dependent oxidoreductase [Pseudomonadota bacterium]
MKSNGKQVIITGASTGIGRELTKLFLADGYRILGVSQRQEGLRELQQQLDPKQNLLSTLSLNLAAPDAAKSLYDYAKSNLDDVDVLVNNAGFACYGPFIDTDTEKLNSMLQLNVVTLTELCHSFGNDMKQRGQGSIINVGSTAGMMPMENFAAYGASKSYINALSYSMRAELAPYNVQVTCVTPAAVATSFAATANIDKAEGNSLLKRLFDSGRVSTPDEIAADAYKGFKQNKAQVLTGKNAWIAVLAPLLIPQRMLPRMFKM